MSIRIGLIGLGNMGQPMAARLLDSGYPLIIYDLVTSRTDKLADKGANVARSFQELARRSDVMITMIPDGKILKSIALGGEGVLENAKPGSILVNMSTVDPDSSYEVARIAETKGIKMLRAPVSGSTILAESGKLTIFVSGDKPAFERCQPIFNTLGQKIFYVGQADEAVYLKLVINIMVGANIQALAEALVLGEKAGLNWEQMLEVIGNSVVSSPLVGYKIPPVAKRSFVPAFTVSMMAKDFDLALAAGQKLGTPLPTASLVRQFLGILQSTGRGDLDFSALVLLMEELSGINHQVLHFDSQGVK